MVIGDSIRDITRKTITDGMLKDMYIPVHNFPCCNRIFNELRIPVRNSVLDLRIKVARKIHEYR